MTVRVLRSFVAKGNPDVLERVRSDRESNLGWIDRMTKEGLVSASPASSLLVLVGGNDPLSFRLRAAQSHVRDDLSPSAWSHVMFVSELKPRHAESPVREVSLAPGLGFGKYGFAPPSNGLQVNRLDAYTDAGRYPNIAILSIPVRAAEVGRALDTLSRQRSILDVPQLIVRWLGYCWGVGVPASPFVDGVGIPSAAMLEAAFAANRFDLTPGLESRSSCPEAIWQAARWWHEFYKKTSERKIAIKGAFSAKHDLVPETHYSKGGTSPQRPGKPTGHRPGSN